MLQGIVLFTQMLVISVRWGQELTNFDKFRDDLNNFDHVLYFVDAA